MKQNVICIITAIVIGAASAQANLLVNGDFESGNTGFTSAYRYYPNGSQGGAGDYYVGDNSKAWNGNFTVPMYDHTTGSGLMLLGNGSYNRSIVWQQTVDVTAGFEYEFSGWVASLYYRSLPRLEFLIDGQPVDSILTKDTTWEIFTATWIASVSGPVTLSIRDLTTAGIGNDFAIDDLSFEQTDTLLPPVINIITPLNADNCVEATGPSGALVEASVGNFIDDPSIVYLWSNSEGAMSTVTNFVFELGVNEDTIIFLTIEDMVSGETASSFEQVRVSDTTSPEITIISPEFGDTFTGNNLHLEVEVKDVADPGIKDYTVNIGSQASYPLDPETGTSRVKLSKPTRGAEPIVTDITVTAEDASGNVSSATVQVMQQHDQRK